MTLKKVFDGVCVGLTVCACLAIAAILCAGWRVFLPIVLIALAIFFTVLVFCRGFHLLFSGDDR